MPRRHARLGDSAPPAHLIAELVSLLDDAPSVDDPADLELLATTLLLPLDLPELPPAVHAAVVDRVEARHDALACAVLFGLAAFATGGLAQRARAAAERLALGGVTHPAAAHVGELAVEAAGRAANEETELLVAVLKRPDTRRRQVLMLGIEHEDTGGALIECVLTPPLPAREARAMLQAPTTDPSAPSMSDIDPAELARRTAAAARRARQVGVALGSGAGQTLPIVSRALTGDPAGLPRPETLTPWEDDDEELAPEADDELDAVVEQLLDELEGFVRAGWPSQSDVWRHADAAAGSMLRWKHARGDGLLGRWTRDDLEAFMLEHVRSDPALDADAIAAMPDAAIAFLRLLDARGSLSGDRLDVLEAACARLRRLMRGRASGAAGKPARTHPEATQRSQGERGATQSRKAQRKSQRVARKRGRRG